MTGIRGLDYIDENGNRVLTGGQKTREANLKNNPNYYRDLGAKGGKATFESHGIKKGFALMDASKLREVSAKGGRKSV